jgi:hypothetical protein
MSAAGWQTTRWPVSKRGQAAIERDFANRKNYFGFCNRWSVQYFLNFEAQVDKCRWIVWESSHYGDEDDQLLMMQHVAFCHKFPCGDVEGECYHLLWNNDTDDVSLCMDIDQGTLARAVYARLPTEKTLPTYRDALNYIVGLHEAGCDEFHNGYMFMHAEPLARSVRWTLQDLCALSLNRNFTISQLFDHLPAKLARWVMRHDILHLE